MSSDFPAEEMALTHLLVVGDLERSRAFYCDVLGTELYRQDGGTPPTREVWRLRGDESLGGKEVRGLLDADLSRDRAHHLVEALNRFF